MSEDPGVLLGILGGSSQNRNKEAKPARPSSFHQPFPARPRVGHQEVGRRVVVGELRGTLRYLGQPSGQEPYAGVELDSPEGTSDGALAGVRYFSCSPLRGLFVPAGEIRLEADQPPPPTPAELKRYSGRGTPGSEFSRNSKNSSSSSLVPSVHCVELNPQSKHSSFEGDDSLGILTPDQMDDLALNLSDDLIRSPSLGISSLITQEDLTLVSLTDSERTSLCKSNSSKLAEALVEIKEEPGETGYREYLGGKEETKKRDAGGSEAKKGLEKSNRTPSVEELPLDGKSGVLLPTSFVTSITSITSLDNGYQGDGEWSRPASRGADHSPSAQKPVRPRMDPMTDSDFFTESDAEELVRGDRRAQVIDGTLYGVRPQRFSPTCEEMDSSGVYSDLERRPGEPSEEAEDRTASPAGSTRTVSSRSDQSLKKNSPTSFSEMIKDQVNTIKSHLLAMEVEAAPPPPASPPRQEPAKKYKTPKRNVVSKIKTMISSGGKKEAEEEAARRTPKKGRWDAVMSKISQGQPEDKSKLREVKSRVFSGLHPTPNPLSASTRSLLQKPLKGKRCRARNSECSLSTPLAAQTPTSSRNSSISDVSQSLRSPLSVRSVKKRDPGRSGSPQTEVSSAKKPAVSSPPKNKPPSGKNVEKPDKTAGSRKNTPRRSASSNSVHKQPSQTNRDGVVQKGKDEKVRTAGGVREAAAVVRVQEAEEKAPATPAPTKEARHILRHASLGVEALAVLVNHLAVNLEAFSTPRLKNELESTRTNWVQAKLELEQVGSSYRRLEEELAAEKLKSQEKEYQFQLDIDQLTKLSSSLENQLQDLQLKHKNQEEELQVLRTLYNEERSMLEGEVASLHVRHSDDVAALKEKHKEAVAELERAKARESEHEKQLVELQAMYDDLKESRKLFIDSLSASDKDLKAKESGDASNGELKAEVDSLRCVLELRCSELQELRRQSQSWQLDAEELPSAKQTIKAQKANIEALEDLLKKKETVEQELLKEKLTLSQSVVQSCSKNKRLTMQNEELTWKLKQKSKVVHVLANMSLDQSVYHTPEMRNARLKNTSTPFKAYDDDIDDTESRSGWCGGSFEGSFSTPSSPKVKAMVDKGDSVSWILDMDEPAEYVASRLLHRATSLRASEPSQRPERSRSSKSLSYPAKESEGVIIVKGNDITVYDVDDTSEITIEDIRLRPKSEEELRMLRRVEESRRSLPKDLAGEAMVSGSASDDDMALDDDSPTRSPDRMDLTWSLPH